MESEKQIREPNGRCAGKKGMKDKRLGNAKGERGGGGKEIELKLAEGKRTSRK